MSESLDRFLEELSKLSRVSGFVIGGCGCDGSPWVDSNVDNGLTNLKWCEVHKQYECKDASHNPEPCESTLQSTETPWWETDEWKGLAPSE